MEEKKVLSSEKEIAVYIRKNDMPYKIDFACVDTSKVRDMTLMFAGMKKLTSLDLSNFKTGKVTDMQFMFFACENMTSLDISSFDTGKVKDMSCMFNGCEALEKVFLGQFDMSNVKESLFMFNGIKPNVEIYLSADSPSVGKIQEQLIKDGVYDAMVHVGDKTYSYDASSKKWNAC